MLGSRILYLKGMRIMIFQLSGFYCMLVSKPAATPEAAALYHLLRLI